MYSYLLTAKKTLYLLFQYYDVEVFHDYFDYLESTYDFVSTVSIGQSYEGRDMRVLRICKGECGDR